MTCVKKMLIYQEVEVESRTYGSPGGSLDQGRVLNTWAGFNLNISPRKVLEQKNKVT